MDSPPEKEGFDKMIQRMRDGKDIDAASDGSRHDDGRASAGWLIWAMSDDLNKDGQVAQRRKILMGSTMLVDGQLDANTAFRAESPGVPHHSNHRMPSK